MDIVERLRHYGSGGAGPINEDCRHAAKLIEQLQTDVRLLSSGGDYLDEIKRLTAERDRLRAALKRIACYDDALASYALNMRGSYGSFDEPGSVQIARETLERKG